MRPGRAGRAPERAVGGRHRPCRPRRPRPAATLGRLANRRLVPDGRRRRRRRIAAALAVPLGGALVFLAIRAAWDGDLFRVREITFRGTVHAEPRVLVAEAGLARRRSILDDFAFVPANLRRDPLVRSARVRRELPGRLIVEIEERVPVAYWSDGELRPVDAEGRVLPLRPSHYGWDLPVLMARAAGDAPAVQDGRLVDADARALLRLAIGIRDRVPQVARRISTAELDAGRRVVLRLMGEGGEVRLRLETPIEKVALLPDVLRDLEVKGTGFRSVDLSFEDQIVVVPTEPVERIRERLEEPAPADSLAPTATGEPLPAPGAAPEDGAVGGTGGAAGSERT